MKRVVLAYFVMLAVVVFAATAAHAASLEVGISFDGANINNSVPPPGNDPPVTFWFAPDSDGAVGPDHVVILVNGRYAVYRKSDGALLQESGLEAFWESAGVEVSPPEILSTFDPRVLYDAASQRWFAVTSGSIYPMAGMPFAYVPPCSLLVGVSRTSDPTQGWTGFAIPSDPDNLYCADFPTLGINAEGVYVAAYMLKVSLPGAGPASSGTDVLVIPKADLLATMPTVANATLFVKQPFTGATAVVGRLPQAVVDLDGGGQPETLLTTASLGEAGGTPVKSSVSGPITAPSLGDRVVILMDAITRPSTADQPGDKMDFTLQNSWNLTSTVVKRNGALWAVQSVLGQTYGNVGVRWMQIDPDANTVLQSGVIEDSDLDLIYPSIAVNQFNEFVIGMTGTSETQFASAYALAGWTLGGVTFLGDLTLLTPGVGDYYRDLAAYGGSNNRWGDYSATVVDPSDPRTFWTFQEYVSAVDEWSVRAVQMSFVGCAATSAGPTFESLRCRIYGLLDRVNAETTLGTFQKRLAKKLSKAGKSEEDARVRCAGSDVEKTSKRLVKAAKLLAAHAKILASNAAIDKLDATLRNELRAAGEAIRPDVELLSQQVACPTDAE